MRLASFFLVSLALHSGALIYPIAFNARTAQPPIAVTILPLESTAGGGGGSAGKAQSAARAMPSPTKPTDDASADKNTVSESVPMPSPVEVAAKINQANIALAAATSVAEITSTAGGSGSAGHGTGGNGFGTNDGTGSGSGSGIGSSQNGSLFTQARYSETPKPPYPESARRENREGRVLLRVLIDDQGKTKSVEVNRSSGHDALDGAAVEAIKRWRFYPARAGATAVESWVSIPIDFRLTDVKNY
jgi:TonB family protein